MSFSLIHIYSYCMIFIATACMRSVRICVVKYFIACVHEVVRCLHSLHLVRVLLLSYPFVISISYYLIFLDCDSGESSVYTLLILRLSELDFGGDGIKEMGMELDAPT